MKPARLLALLLCAAAPLACARAPAATTVPASASTTVISMQGIDCESCGAQAITAVTQRPGVYAASFDRVLAELTVQYDATKTGPADFVAVVEGLGYRGFEGPGRGAYIPEVELPAGADVVKISTAGEAVELRDHLAAGKVTVVDFYAVWCEPCRKVDEHMKQVLAAHDDVALRKVDVVDWDSEVARQHLRDVPDLPHVIVFGRSGKQVAAISGLKLEALDAAIEKARSK
jgi:thiol-disulfide isomerase/thioredoxin/copper chaperone CopZ